MTDTEISALAVHIDKGPGIDAYNPRTRINDCHRRLHFYNERLWHPFNKLQQIILTVLSDTSKTIAYKRADKNARQHHVQAESKLTWQNQNKTPQELVQEYFFPSLKNETKHTYFITDWNVLLHRNVYRPKILYLKLPESTKDSVRSRIASTLQSASLTNCNLTKDERQDLKRLTNNKAF